MGDLRRRRPRHRLRRLPQGPPAADQRRVRAAARRARANGPGGKVIDMLAIFATLFGSAASLGLGALQIGSGLQIVAGIGKVGNTVLIVIIAVLTVCVHAVGGLRASPRASSGCRTSTWCSALALAAVRLRRRPDGLHPQPRSRPRSGSYFQDLAMMSARTDAEGGDGRRPGCSRWTIFYWAWWVSLDAVRRHVHRPDLARPHHPPVRHRRAAGAERGLAGVVRVFGGAAIDVAAGRRRPRRRRAASRAQLFGAARPVPARDHRQRPGDGAGRRSSSCPAPTPPRS